MSKRSGSGITRLGASVSLASRGSQSAWKLPAAIPGTAHHPTTAFQTFQAGRGLAVPVIAFAMGMSPTLSHLRSLTMMAGLQGNYFDILQHKDITRCTSTLAPVSQETLFLSVSACLHIFSLKISTLNSKNSKRYEHLKISKKPIILAQDFPLAATSFRSGLTGPCTGTPIAIEIIKSTCIRFF